MTPTDRKVVQLLKSAQACIERGETEGAADLFEQAANRAKGDIKAIKAALVGLVDLGFRQRAMTLIGRVAGLLGESEELNQVIGMMATKMQQFDLAERAFMNAVRLNRDNPSNIVNLTSAMLKTGKAEQAIAILQETIERFPTHAKLWNALGTILKESRGASKEAAAFFQQAYILAPDDADILHNASFGAPPDEALIMLDKALGFQPDNSMIHLSKATILMGQGRYQAALPHYMHRLDTNSSLMRAARYPNLAPLWQGQSLENKTILVMAEQGIGDELFFALSFPGLIAQANRVIISADDRLIDIFARSFDADIIGYTDTFEEGYRYRSFPDLSAVLGRLGVALDFVVHAGSLPGLMWADDQIPTIGEGLLKPDPILSEQMRARFQTALAKNGRLGQLFVGLSWRSGDLSGERKHAQLSLTSLSELRGEGDRCFLSLQYAADTAEVQSLREQAGLVMFDCADLDLKQDIEANLALMSVCDLVIGPAVTTQMLALMSGTPTWVATVGIPWWARVNEQNIDIAFAPDCRIYAQKSGDWVSFYKSISNDISEFAAKTSKSFPT